MASMVAYGGFNGGRREGVTRNYVYNSEIMYIMVKFMYIMVKI